MLNPKNIYKWQYYFFAPVYDFLFMGPQDELIQQTLEPKPESINLDLGGGTGQLFQELIRAEVLEPSKTILCDRSHSMLHQAQQKGLAGILQGSGDNLPLKHRTINRVFICQTLHHVENYEKALKESCRVLTDGGKIIINEIDPTTLPGKLIWNMECLLGFESRFLRPKAIEQSLLKFGFKIIEKRKKYHKYLLVAEYPRS